MQKYSGPKIFSYFETFVNEVNLLHGEHTNSIECFIRRSQNVQCINEYHSLVWMACLLAVIVLYLSKQVLAQSQQEKHGKKVCPKFMLKIPVSLLTLYIVHSFF